MSYLKFDGININFNLACWSHGYLALASHRNCDKCAYIVVSYYVRAKSIIESAVVTY